ncbi:glycosyltransferase family A protein [Paraglaciecola sp.]|uniref:glycosyltransferase n=1 Tax=Paraglaciecola sp. TaxID=1920173 RepID=UPI0030F42738
MIENKQKHLSFIIPHKGRFEMLIETIESIALQKSPTFSVDVIVVSQTPEIQTCTLTENQDLPLSVFIRPPEETISSLRNFGVTQTKGEFLAFLDADIYLSANWAEQMLKELSSQDDRIIVSAQQICAEDAPPLEKIRTFLSNVEIDKNVAFLPGRNLFMTRDAFHQIGGFPEQLVTCEDYYFTDKAAKLGKLFYTSSATYRHIGEDKAYKAMFDKEIWRGQSNIQSLSGRDVPLRELPSFFVPPAILILIITALVLLIVGITKLAMLALALALLPVIVYSLRLLNIAKSEVSFAKIVLFYAVYFPARAIGTLVGVFKTIKVKQS